MISTTEGEIKGIKPPNYGRRMPAPIALIGLNQLDKIDTYNEVRRKTAKDWDAWTSERGYEVPSVLPGTKPVFLRYPVIVEPEKKKNTRWSYKDPGVQIGVWFISNVHPANRRISGCPNANIAVRQCINFPSILN